MNVNLPPSRLNVGSPTPEADRGAPAGTPHAPTRSGTEHGSPARASSGPSSPVRAALPAAAPAPAAAAGAAAQEWTLPSLFKKGVEGVGAGVMAGVGLVQRLAGSASGVGAGTVQAQSAMDQVLASLAASNGAADASTQQSLALVNKVLKDATGVNRLAPAERDAMRPALEALHQSVARGIEEVRPRLKSELDSIQQEPLAWGRTMEAAITRANGGVSINDGKPLTRQAMKEDAALAQRWIGVVGSASPQDRAEITKMVQTGHASVIRNMEKEGLQQKALFELSKVDVAASQLQRVLGGLPPADIAGVQQANARADAAATRAQAIVADATRGPRPA